MSFRRHVTERSMIDTVSQRPNFNVNHVGSKGWGEMVNASGNMVQLAPAINQDCKSRRGEIISRTLFFFFLIKLLLTGVFCLFVFLFF